MKTLSVPTAKGRSNGSTSKPGAVLHNFLFILPQPTPAEGYEMIGNIAATLADAGYVYVADASQRSMEDRGFTRYLPFNPERFPSFGELTAVIVVGDRDVAQAALEEYPGAQVYLLESNADAPASHPAWPRLRDWVAKGHLLTVGARSRAAVAPVS